MADKKPTKEQYAKFKSRANDQSISAEARATFQKLVDKFKDEFETAEKDVEKVVEDKPKAKRGRKPSTSTATKRGRKPSAKKTEQSADDIAKAKAEIKKRTGKTEEECESIIEEYKALRTKAQTRKKAETKAKEDNVKRVTKLKKDNNVIEGTTEKTADAVIETNTKDIAEKIEKEISKVEDKVEKEETAKIKKEVEKQSPNKSATEKKKEVEKKVEEKVEKKVKEKTKVVVKKVIIDTTAMLSSIAESLGKFDKDSQKEFLMKLRSDIDKLLTKYMYGGDVSGATQQLDITQSNLSSSSVNMFARGGGVGKWSVTDITNATYLGVIEFQDNKGEFHNFEVMETDDRLVFGGMTNSGFIESGYIEKDGFSTDEALQSLLEDLEVYYNDGAEYTSQIVFNQRMAKGGSTYARGGGVSFKPYGKTKGKFTITYIEEGKPQSETWESIEMARDRVRRLTKMSGVSNVKLDEFARGGRMRGSRPKYVRRNMRGMINQRRGM
jgi:chemotaxis protein histidine kinase CheA